jgi:hypothetical protein
MGWQSRWWWCGDVIVTVSDTSDEPEESLYPIQATRKMVGGREK